MSDKIIMLSYVLRFYDSALKASILLKFLTFLRFCDI